MMGVRVMSSVKRLGMGCIGALCVILLVACPGTEPPDDPDPVEVPVPQIDALSAYQASVGEPLRFMGSGFIGEEEGYTEVTFRGTYNHDGIDEPVNFSVEVGRDDENTVTWDRFGPYQIPFTRSGNKIGTFQGEVFATNFTHDGQERRQTEEFHSVDFEVRPSLVVRDLTAFGDTFSSDCNFVGTRVVNFVPYRMGVEAVGFEAEEFVYTVSSGLLDQGEFPTDGPTTFNHGAGSSLDALGEIESLRFAEVPMGVPVYRSSISVDAISTSGEHFEQFLMLTVHEPLFVRYRGGVEVAEIYEPTPVSSCMHGGPNGADVTYGESVSETKTISSSQTLTAGWTSSYTQQHSESYGEGGVEANTIGFSTSDQSHWNFNVHGEGMIGAEGGFGPFAKAKASVTIGGGTDWGSSHTDTRQGQQSWSQTTNYSESVSRTEQNQESITEAMTRTQTTSETHTTLLNYNRYLLPNQFGVFYRQTTRMVRRAEVVAMDLCGNETIIGEFVMNDYTWAPDLAMGPECPPFPVSVLPIAECLIPPCDEGN